MKYFIHVHLNRNPQCLWIEVRDDGAVIAVTDISIATPCTVAQVELILSRLAVEGGFKEIHATLEPCDEENALTPEMKKVLGI